MACGANQITNPFSNKKVSNISPSLGLILTLLLSWIPHKALTKVGENPLLTTNFDWREEAAITTTVESATRQ